MACKLPGYASGPTKTGGNPGAYLCEVPNHTDKVPHMWKSSSEGAVTWPVGKGKGSSPDLGISYTALDEYCAACLWELQVKKHDDPCGAGTPDKPADGCYYYSAYMDTLEPVETPGWEPCVSNGCGGWFHLGPGCGDCHTCHKAVGKHTICKEKPPSAPASATKAHSEPKKKPWPFYPPNIGCIACAWHLSIGGGAKACSSNLGPSGASDICFAYDAWMSHHTPKTKKPPKLPYSDEVPKFTPLPDAYGQSVEAAQNTTPYGGEQKTGVHIGLKLDLDLANMCADYYVLERLVNDLFEREQYNVSDSKGKPVYFDQPVWVRGKIVGYQKSRLVRMRLSNIPKRFGSDTRQEWRAYQTKSYRENTNEFLAKQLATYLIIACGGELRHAPSRTDIQVTSAGIKPIEVCPHKCDSTKCYSSCKHTHTKKCRIQVSKRLHKYWMYTRSFATSESRHKGWQKWHTLTKRNPVVWMRECAVVFNDLNWRKGYGGKPWGFAANLVADYLAGDISAELFIDRCWSLEHHGGCIFNKFWLIESLRSKKNHDDTLYVPGTGAEASRIQYVLALQQHGDYDLLAEFCTFEIGLMWNEHSAERKRLEAQQSFIDRMLERMRRGGD